jgi:hypothetical protein
VIVARTLLEKKNSNESGKEDGMMRENTEKQWKVEGKSWH